MGCCGSGMRDRFQEALVPLRKFNGRLGIDQESLWPLYKQFEKVDRDKSGEINIDEFFDHFGLEWSRFAERAFMVMEVSGDHKLSFAEFTVGLMNYCTCTHDGIVRLAFDLFDDDHSGHIDRLEMKKLLKMVQNKRKPESYYDEIMRKMDKDKDGDVTWNEFRDFNKKMASLLQPAFFLQRDLRKKIMGGKFWDQYTKARKMKCPKQDLISLQHSLNNDGEKLDRKELKSKAAKRSHGIVEWEKGRKGKTINVYPAPDKSTKPVGKEKFKAQIEIFEKQHEAKGGSWYKINEKGDERWVEAKYVTIDKFWEKKSKEQADMDKERQQLKDNKEKAASDKAARIKEAKKQWMESTDKKSGQKYWYNVETNETTWNNPFK